MPAERPTFGLSKQALRDAAKLLALGKAAGVKRVTIYGAVFDFPRPQQDSAAEQQSDEHAPSNSSSRYRVQGDIVATCHGTQDARRHHSAVVSARRQYAASAA